MTSGTTVGAGIRLARDLQLLPESYLFGLSHVLSHSRAHPAFMNGHYSRVGWPLFFPYATLVKTPLPVFAIAAIAVCAAVLPFREPGRTEQPFGRRARRIMIGTYRTALLWAFLVVYWAVALRVHLSIGERHVLPIYPAGFILCGAAGRWIRSRHRLLTAALFGALSGWGWSRFESSPAICPISISLPAGRKRVRASRRQFSRLGTGFVSAAATARATRTERLG